MIAGRKSTGLRRWVRRIVLGLAGSTLLLLLAGGGAVVWLRAELRSSLPVLDGSVAAPGLGSPVEILRDELGVPRIRGTSREDLAWATGFLHAQERFFQMDLLRRLAAGELSELFGRTALGADRAQRRHRFRALARRVVGSAEPRERNLIETYTRGVNAGLAQLGAAPPEYLLLRQAPRPWAPEDSLLTLLAMYIRLQEGDGRREAAIGLMQERLPVELFEFLLPTGTAWDAPLVGPAFSTPPVPGPGIYDLRRNDPRPTTPPAEDEVPLVAHAGSNGWAVAGRFTGHGSALLANDMHLGLSLPNTWYRASFEWTPGSGPPQRVTGVTLPGAPVMIAGSNGSVAWGFTNSYADISDLVLIELDPRDPDRYGTPGGTTAFQRFDETIEVRDAEPEPLEVVWTIWGPLVDRDSMGRPRALRWVAHDEAAINLGLLGMETAGSVAEALDVAPVTGIPLQNLICADAAGHIGWTTMGRIPRRRNLEGNVPASWSDGSRGWDGWLDPDEYPRLLDPQSGRIWSANNRMVDGPALARLGDGGYALGARAGQIRDRLLESERADPDDMLAIQLDDRALFLERWRQRLLVLLDASAVESHPRRARFRHQVEAGWSGRASVDSVGYRLVRGFRVTLARRVFGAITASCKQADPSFDYLSLAQWEGPLWRLIEEQPAHLLDPERERWRGAMLSAVDQTIEALERDERTLESRTWGDRNTIRVAHPLSAAVSRLSRWLDAPARALPGDAHMPRVQGPGFGASQRMAVSPGHEEQGYFHMPGGQSGHPLSAFYLAGHDAWEQGRKAPFLPGPTVHVLGLVPTPR